MVKRPYFYRKESLPIAPAMSPNAARNAGKICGVRVEEIEDPMMQKIRWLDKLVDELAKGSSWRRYWGNDLFLDCLLSTDYRFLRRYRKPTSMSAHLLMMSTDQKSDAV